MGTYTSSGAAKKGSTPKKLVVVGNNTATVEEKAAKGARGHIQELLALAKIEKTEEEGMEVVLFDDEDEIYSTDEDSDDEDESDFFLESTEESEERVKILADTTALKKLATEYFHPEVKVMTSDPCTFGRNFFSRPSTVGMESKEEAEERTQILADAVSLKKLAADYMHPEVNVTAVHPCAFGRNFFTGPSAIELESKEEAEERAQILDDAKALKKISADYMHPEIKVTTSDPCAFGRNFFGRPSAVEVEPMEESEERAQILADASALRKLATDHMHPEIKMAKSVPSSYGRNYFSRYSVVELESKEEGEERAQILADAIALKQLATDFMHPEVKVATSDSCVFGRNCFSRPSAVEVESMEEGEERNQILADAVALKKLATAYMHPEVNVSEVHPCAFGRNYFNMPSVVEMEFKEDAEDSQILIDAAALKKLATDYMHPEIKVRTSDPCTFGRNFFGRTSAVESESKEEAVERAQILADAVVLKKLVTDYMHPEIKVATSDSCSFGRNYFTRATATYLAPVKLDSHRERAESIFSIDDPLADVDEIVLDEMRSKFSNLDMGVQHLAHKSLVKRVEENIPADQDAGKISRSPSSVVLFGLEEY